MVEPLELVGWRRPECRVNPPKHESKRPKPPSLSQAPTSIIRRRRYKCHRINMTHTQHQILLKQRNKHSDPKKTHPHFQGLSCTAVQFGLTTPFRTTSHMIPFRQRHSRTCSGNSKGRANRQRSVGHRRNNRSREKRR